MTKLIKHIGYCVCVCTDMRVLLRKLVCARWSVSGLSAFTRSHELFTPVAGLQPVKFISVLKKQNVRVVNIKRREDTQNVFADTSEDHQSRPVSSSSVQNSPANQTPDSGSVNQTQAKSGSANQTPPDSGSANQTPPDSGSANQTPPDSGSANQTPPDSGSVNQTPPDSELANQQLENMIEAVVGSVSDFKDGQMQEVDVGDKKVLLAKEGGQFYAVANKCTHYGAPLTKGAYCQGIVRCPWHGACFSVKTGDIEDYPGLDSLQKYEVEVKGDKVVVKADPAALENTKRIKPMVKKAANNNKTVVLVGGGPASLVCAETLRQEGYTGRVVLVSQESSLPYDRIKLSKALNIKPEEIALRNQEFYDQNGIELLLGKSVTKLEVDDKKIVLEDGQSLSYDVLLVATGGKPRSLPIPGSDLKNVYMLRTPKDAHAIAENSQGKNVVIIGSSFIGLEVANYMVGKAAVVNVIGQSAIPLAHVFGPKIGDWFRKLHEEKGVIFHFETSVSEFHGEGGQVQEAVLANGTVLPCDVCVMGVGVVPATDFLKDSGLNLTSRGFVTVDKHMQTNIPDVYAAGDIVEFPLFTVDNQQVNIQHWQMAHQHGRIAGLSIAGKAQDIHSVPYFWTMQYGKSVRYTGYGPGYDDVVLHGDLKENKFVAYYTKKDKVVAVASLGWDPIVSQAAELFSKGGSISKDEIKDNPESWVTRLGEA